MKQLVLLSLFFARLSVTSFGGGYALIPIIKESLGIKKG